MKKIPLTQGKVALVDDEDYERVNQYKWRAHKCSNSFYAARTLPRIKGETRKVLLMHRSIMDTPKGVEVDHRDHDGLNNQKYNLREATNAQNCTNRKKQNSTTSSKYKGIYFNKSRRKWLAQIQVDKKRKYLGYFTEEIKAALAYDRAALIHFGEFTYLNFPNGEL